MAIKDRIKEARLKKGYTQEQLAKSIGVAKSTVTGYEKGNSEPSIDTIIKIMSVLNVDANYLWQDECDFPMKVSYDEMQRIDKFRFLDDSGKKTVDHILEHEFERMEQLKQKDDTIKFLHPSIPSTDKNPPNKIVMRTYPYFNKIACAGTGFYFDDIPMATIEAPEYPDADFIIGVNGDSMEPDFSDGDMVYVKRASELKIGEIGIFTIGNECYIKELGKDGLISKNKKYGNIRGNEDVRLIGKVIGKIEKS